MNPTYQGLGYKVWDYIGARDHLLHCNYLPSFDNFKTSANKNKKLY